MRFIALFLQDDSFAALCRAMEECSREQAFHAAHTLKGVCANLCLDRLLASASRLTEVLRPAADAMPEQAQPLFEAVQQDYAVTTQAIRAYLPPGTRCEQLSTLPRGFRLICVRTASGKRLMMCFRPRGLYVRDGRVWRAADAVVAVSPCLHGRRALLPPTLNL